MSDDAIDKGKRARRIDARFSANFTGKQVDGSGIVHNISLSGALIEEASALLLAGGFVRIQFSFYENSLPVSVEAKVVRETSNGFAVRFVKLDARVREGLRMAIAQCAEGQSASALLSRRR